MKRPHPKSVFKNARSRTLMRYPSLSYGALPLIIMILVVIACLIGYSLATANVEVLRSRSIDRRFRENELRVDTVFDSYAHLLWGSTGRLQSGEADESSWQRYIGVYDLPKNFSGMEAIGLSYGNNTADSKIAYVSPKTAVTSQAIGFNLGQMPVLVKAMDQAARTGQTTISDPLPNLFSTKGDVTTSKTGFLVFSPFYDPTQPITTPDERMQVLRGYTVAMFRGDIFFDQVFSDADLSHTQIQVYLGNAVPANLLYKTSSITDRDVRTVTQQFSEYGKTFTMVYTFDTASILVFSLNYFPQFLLFGGLILGALFAGVSGYLLRSRYQRLTYEKERDVDFAKDELLSMASHQLRTPATGVKQYLGMVLQGFAGEVTDQQRAYLERADASNNRQLHVINDILHVAKLETGRIVLTERKFNIAKMIRDVIDEQRDQAEKGEVSLELRSPPQGWMVGDSHMLWMVVENLVNNAIKYTPTGGTVKVRLVRRANHWLITVKDTGVGIDKADYPKLFKQFSRILNPRSDLVTGTGVGLYLAHHLTVLHGGTIGVSSTKGKGTIFTIRLPRKM